MQVALRTSLLEGYFDTKIFRQGVARENRVMKQDGETITFDIAFSEYPSEFARENGAEFIRETEVNGLKRWYVSLKVGRICRFFDRGGHVVERPKNAELDGKRWQIVAQYKVLHGDPSKMEARGFWADAIQLKPADEIVFAPMDGETPKSIVTDEYAQQGTEEDLVF